MPSQSLCLKGTKFDGQFQSMGDHFCGTGGTKIYHDSPMESKYGHPEIRTPTTLCYVRTPLSVPLHRNLWSDLLVLEQREISCVMSLISAVFEGNHREGEASPPPLHPSPASPSHSYEMLDSTRSQECQWSRKL